jgi:predicted nucleic-acid-binding protein
VIVGLDTTVVVRLLTGKPEALAAVALDYVLGRTQAGDRVLVSDWVVAESYYALQYHYQASKKDTLGALRSLFTTPGIEASAEVSQVLATRNLESAKPGFIDRLIHSSYLRAGVVEVVTFERAAAKLSGVRVLSA